MNTTRHSETIEVIARDQRASRRVDCGAGRRGGGAGFRARRCACRDRQAAARARQEALENEILKGPQ